MSAKKRSAAAVDETAAPATNENITLEKVENNLARGPDFKALSAVEAFVSFSLLMLLCCAYICKSFNWKAEFHVIFFHSC